MSASSLRLLILHLPVRWLGFSQIAHLFPYFLQLLAGALLNGRGKLLRLLPYGSRHWAIPYSWWHLDLPLKTCFLYSRLNILAFLQVIFKIFLYFLCSLELIIFINWDRRFKYILFQRNCGLKLGGFLFCSIHLFLNTPMVSIFDRSCARGLEVKSSLIDGPFDLE